MRWKTLRRPRSSLLHTTYVRTSRAKRKTTPLLLHRLAPGATSAPCNFSGHSTPAEAVCRCSGVATVAGQLQAVLELAQPRPRCNARTKRAARRHTCQKVAARREGDWRWHYRAHVVRTSRLTLCVPPGKCTGVRAAAQIVRTNAGRTRCVPDDVHVRRLRTSRVARGWDSYDRYVGFDKRSVAVHFVT